NVRQTDRDGRAGSVPVKQEDVILLVRSTARLYLRTINAAVTGFGANIHLIAVHLALVLAGFVLAPWVAAIGGFIGGLLLGLFEAALVAAYLATVEAAVRGGTLRFGDVWPQMTVLFGPAISVFFLYFVAGLLFEGLSPELSEPLSLLFLVVCSTL